MSDEIVENKNTDAVTTEKEDLITSAKQTENVHNITLETLANDVAAMQRDFYQKLHEKDNEIAALKENNSKLEKTVNDQNSLIGNFRETVFNNARVPPENTIDPNDAHVKQCYEDAYRAAYNWMKPRLIGKNNDENLFVSKCMEVDDGRIL